jgi:phosphoesterase RecJ-like protein
MKNMNQASNTSKIKYTNDSRSVKEIEKKIFFNFFQGKSRLAIVSHLDPDGDAMASLSAMTFFCEKQNIFSQIFQFNEPPFPEYNYWNISIDNIDNLCLNKFDGIIFVDTPSLKRAGFKDNFEVLIPSISIDHHIDNKYFADFSLIYPSFCATAEIIFELLRNSLNHDLPLDKKIMEALLMGILFDTYYFQTENVDSILLERASYLESKTNSIHILKNILFKNQTPQIYSFWGKILLNTSLYFNKQVVVAKADDFLYSEFEKKDKNFSRDFASEGFINHLMNLRNVEIAIFIRELTDVYKVSIRSSIKIASRLANRFGGGGHENAAAFRIDKKVFSSIDELENSIINTINEIWGEKNRGDK